MKTLIGRLKCWWYRRHVTLLAWFDDGHGSCLLCVRCGKVIE